MTNGLTNDRLTKPLSGPSHGGVCTQGAIFVSAGKMAFLYAHEDTSPFQKLSAQGGIPRTLRKCFSCTSRARGRIGTFSCARFRRVLVRLHSSRAVGREGLVDLVPLGRHGRLGLGEGGQPEGDCIARQHLSCQVKIR